jgi:hypothetical protein
VEDLEEFEVGDPKKKVRIGSQLPQHKGRSSGILEVQQ